MFSLQSSNKILENTWKTEGVLFQEMPSCLENILYSLTYAGHCNSVRVTLYIWPLITESQSGWS